MDRLKLLIPRNDNDKPIDAKLLFGFPLATLFLFATFPLKDATGTKQLLEQQGYQSVNIIGRGDAFSTECRGLWRTQFSAVRDSKYVVGTACRNLLSPSNKAQIHVSNVIS